MPSRLHSFALVLLCGLVAGRALLGKHPIMIGLGLWADQPNSLDKVTLEPNQWLDVMRLQRSDY